MRLAAGAAAAALALVGWTAGVSAATEPGTASPGRPSMHESTTPSPSPEHSEHSEHSGHDMSDMTEEEMAEMDHGNGVDDGAHDQHGSTPDTVSSGTRAAVLGGFAVVNAGVLGGALLLRR
ncbi:hypothetical protein, partial [Nocardioides sp.]|uniref:hypothetical protein n=1 Tax=Nocardioides sp. TaxID=35761 RepID=UPI002ED91885